MAMVSRICVKYSDLITININFSHIKPQKSISIPGMPVKSEKTGHVFKKGQLTEAQDFFDKASEKTRSHNMLCRNKPGKRKEKSDQQQALWTGKGSETTVHERLAEPTPERRMSADISLGFFCHR